MVPEEGVEGAIVTSIDGTSQACEPSPSPKAPDEARSTPDPASFGPTFGPTDPVAAALARALDAAAAAGRFDVVAQLAEELRARRLAASGNVVELAPDRRQRR